MSYDTSDTTPDARSPEPTDTDSGLPITDEETSLVIEFTAPPEAFVLADTLEKVPERVLEFEQLVPTTEGLLPYLWVTDSGLREFEHAAVNDPTVASLRRVAELDAGALYRVAWTDEANHLLTGLCANDAVVLQAETKHERWHVKLRVDSRASLSDLQTFCRDQDIPLEVIRLYELSDPTSSCWPNWMPSVRKRERRSRPESSTSGRCSPARRITTYSGRGITLSKKSGVNRTSRSPAVTTRLTNR